jgi:hypothetical protein
MTKIRTVLGYLSYINDNNLSRRSDNFLKSIESLKEIKKNNSIVTVNFDNNSCIKARNTIIQSGVFNKCYFFDKNFYDISVLFGTYHYAKKNNLDFMIYAYDDLLYMPKSFLLDCEKFLDKNKDVDCIRLCKYEKDNPYYNTAYVNKTKNPDAINHYVSHKKNARIQWEPSQNVGENIFHVCDWHYTSRSTMFRVSSFEKLLNNNADLPVLSFFEGYAYKYHAVHGIKIGILEGGIFKTLAQHDSSNSERLFLGDNYYRDKFVTTKDIIDIMEKIDESV